jgi:hypothetical protein
MLQSEKSKMQSLGVVKEECSEWKNKKTPLSQCIIICWICWLSETEDHMNLINDEDIQAD